MVVKIFGKEVELKQSSICIIIVGILIAFFAFNALTQKGDDILVQPAVVEKPVIPTKIPSPPPEKVRVYVCGMVNHPGVYTLLKGCIVQDALKIAGETKKNALINFNLAWEIQQNVMISVPSKSNKRKTPVIITTIDDSENGGISGQPISGEGGMPGGKINLNTANQEQLMEIPGVGESTANKIIEYRKERRFQSIEDIKEVSGIGDKKFEDMKPFICV